MHDVEDGWRSTMNDPRFEGSAAADDGGADRVEGHDTRHRLAKQVNTGAKQVQVRVLGPPAILDVPDRQHVRPQAVEFLVHLIVQGGSAYQQEILDDLMPEPPRRLAAQRLHTYTYNLRRICSLIGGENTYLQLKRHRYTLNRDAFDVDLWTMRDAITAAQSATEPAARVAALRRAVDVYRGPLADHAGYPWLAPHRDTVTREFVTAALTLAEALADRPAEARSALQAAASHHPDDERLAAALLATRRRPD
ncbi:AfsR/SARP family transcriptional regulator [Micromonospora sp. DT229]|uniref:AfsR/SARP family transcriptional regulator n=1 Tax=Micromonospora sp. DT229 TaxID=3393430 RepID=UPI003CEBB727